LNAKFACQNDFLSLNQQLNSNLGLAKFAITCNDLCLIGIMNFHSILMTFPC
jgi:hypothetical protein